MTLPHRLSAVALVLMAALAGCGDDTVTDTDPDKAGQSAPADAGPCLVTAEQLEEITGTAQTIQEVDVPDDLGANQTCGTQLDERDVSMKWSLSEPFIDPPPTHEEQRVQVEDPGLTVEEADLGDGQDGWIGAGQYAGLPRARIYTILDGLALSVEVTATDKDAGLQKDEIADEALQLARAVVVASRA